MPRQPADQRVSILARIKDGIPGGRIWTWSDFADLGSHENVDRILQRLAASGESFYADGKASGDWTEFFKEPRVLRAARGLYFAPARNGMTRRPTVPSTENVIEAVVARSNGRWLIPPESAAHNLGMTNLVPARIVVDTDARIQDVQLGKMTIEFRTRSASRLYWSGKPAAAVLQGLSYVRDLMNGAADGEEQIRLRRCVVRYLNGPKGAEAIEDLRAGVEFVDGWMRDQVDLAMREAGQAPVFAPSWQDDPDGAGTAAADDVPSGPRP